MVKQVVALLQVGHTVALSQAGTHNTLPTTLLIHIATHADFRSDMGAKVGVILPPHAQQHLPHIVHHNVVLQEQLLARTLGTPGHTQLGFAIAALRQRFTAPVGPHHPQLVSPGGQFQLGGDVVFLLRRRTCCGLEVLGIFT